MTDNLTIWKTLQNNLPKKTWIPIRDIFETVRASVPLDSEDLTPYRIGMPRWESNVRSLLRVKERMGSVHARRSAVR